MFVVGGGMDKRRELRPGYPSTQTSSIEATSALPFQNEIAITRTQSRDESLNLHSPKEREESKKVILCDNREIK